MPTSHKCPQCGVVLSPGSPEGLCPVCLRERQLDITKPSTDPHSAGVVSPTIRYIGDYEIQREIARGGMGVVYKARQRTLNRPVAVKMLLAGALADEAAIKRFHTEAEAAANLQHPNIVAIHEIGMHDGHHYFSMDYVEGTSLAEIVGGKPLPPMTAATYVKTMAEAIHFAHQRGILHRDLKPSNVLIDPDDRPHITDFGLAKIASREHDLTITGAVMGTASYMSPEQASGRLDRIGPHSDVYSLGAILYELLTGRPPFREISIQATLVQVTLNEPTSPRKLNAAVPTDLETISLKCLEKPPERRYATASELADDLGRFLRGEPILARPVSAGRRIEHWLKRHPLAGSLAWSLVVVVLVALSYGLWQQNRYLVWQATHPQAQRIAGSRTAYAKRLDDAGSVIFGVVILTQILAGSRLRRMRKSQTRFDSKPSSSPVWFHGKLGPPAVEPTLPQSRPLAGPVRPVILRLFECMGCVAIGFALFLLMKLIDAWVWEGYARGTAWFQIYLLTSIGGSLVSIARRIRRVQVFGPDTLNTTM